ncbi:MAG: hypothetical protein AAB425_13155, partial [Bdellovibrionota bacterium]
YEEPTPLLSNGLAETQEQSPIKNYSSAFAKLCQESDQTCRETVTITVYKPNYDYWCFNYWMYCPHTHVYSTHPWNGTLEIETDETVALQ